MIPKDQEILRREEYFTADKYRPLALLRKGSSRDEPKEDTYVFIALSFCLEVIFNAYSILKCMGNQVQGIAQGPGASSTQLCCKNSPF